MKHLRKHSLKKWLANLIVFSILSNGFLPLCAQVVESSPQQKAAQALGGLLNPLWVQHRAPRPSEQTIEFENPSQQADVFLGILPRDISIQGQLNVTGDLTVQGTIITPSGALSGRTLTLFEDPINGTNAITLEAPANLAADYSLVLPPDAGSLNYVLATDGFGNLNWIDPGSAGGIILDGGNSFGNSIVIGTNDNFGFNLETFGTDRIQISNTGVITVLPLAAAGVVHTDGFGQLSTSQVVNNDIANNTISDVKLLTISTAGKVANSATTATNANSANAIVARDASGDFSAGTISAALIGNVTGSASLNVLKSGDTMTGNLVMANQSQIRLGDSGSKYIALQAPATVTTNYGLVFPSQQGSLDDVLVNNGAGVLSWQAGSALTGVIKQGGNAFGVPMVIGTNDNFGMNLETNGVTQFSIASAGALTASNLAGTGDRIVQASATGALSAQIPTGVKNVIQVIKDSPVVAGKFYSTIKDAVDWANANVTEPTSIVVASGTYVIDQTIQITNEFVHSIIGEDLLSVYIVPDQTLAGNPIFLLNQTLGGGEFGLSLMTISGFGVTDWMTTPGSVAIQVTGEGYFLFNRLGIQGCYQGFNVTGPTSFNPQFIFLENSYFSTAGDCHFFADNGSQCDISSVVFLYPNAQVLRVKKTNSLAPQTNVAVSLARVTGNGVGGFVEVYDDACVKVSSSSVVGLQDVFIVDDNGTLECIRNIVIDGDVTNYQQLSSTAHLIVNGDILPDAHNVSKIIVTNSANVLFNIIDAEDGETILGNFSDADTAIIDLLNGHGEGHDPSLTFRQNWFDARGLVYESPLASLSGVLGGMSIASSIDSNAMMGALVRGATADSYSPALTLATYADAGDPASADLSLLRRWTVEKEPATHNLDMSYWNGSAENARLTLTPTGNLGLGTTMPSSTLEIGSGQIAALAGTSTSPGYAFAGNLNTGVYSPALNALSFTTAGSPRLTVNGSGIVTIAGFASAGVVHNDNSGNLSTSLIVNADITTGTIADDKLATITTAGKVANSATTATSANTASTIVARDASGNFSAGTITANLTGSASQNVLKAGDTMTGNLVMDNQSQIRLREQTTNGTNYIALQAPSLVTSDTVLTLPNGAGSANQVLTSVDGTGTLAWQTATALPGVIVQDGNAFGAAMTIGTNDAFGMNLETNGVNRLSIDSAGALNASNLAGTGDRVLQTGATGDLSAILPTGVKNVIQVIKDSPVVVGKFYPTIKDAVDWANANATEPTAIFIAAGNHYVDTTITVTNSFVKSIIGVETASVNIIPTLALIGSPVFVLNQAFSFTPFILQNFSISGFGVPGWTSTAGDVGVLISGNSRFVCDHVSILGCYRGIEGTGGAGTGLQNIIINDSFIASAGDCGILGNNGTRLVLSNVVLAASGNQQIRIERSNVLAVETHLVMVAGQLSNELAGTGDGILAKDVSRAQVSGIRAYALQNIFTAQDNAQFECVNNIEINGTAKHYRQLSSTASMVVNGDVVCGLDLSKFVITNSATVGFSLVDSVTGERAIGSFSDQDNDLFTILTGHGIDDPYYHYENAWFGLRGLVADFPEASLTGVAGGMKAISTFNNDACNVSLVRGLSAHSFKPCVDLSTYESDGDPSSPDMSLLRRWGIEKEPITHNLGMSFWNGATENTRLTLIPSGNLGLGTTTPNSTLEIGTGQIAAPAGTAEIWIRVSIFLQLI
jgi:hypothetical protein